MTVSSMARTAIKVPWSKMQSDLLLELIDGSFPKSNIDRQPFRAVLVKVWS